MSDPYVGEIRMFAGSFAPQGWAFCDGQLLSILENQALFTLIGTTYGGDGENTFALPDLRGRIPIAASNGYPLGMKDGVENVALALSQIPQHTHMLNVSSSGNAQVNPNSNVLGQAEAVNLYIEEAPTISMHPASVTMAGAGQPHSNMMPTLCINFIISLYGIFPAQG